MEVKTEMAEHLLQNVANITFQVGKFTLNSTSSSILQDCNLTLQDCNGTKIVKATYPAFWTIPLSARIVLIILYSVIFLVGVSGNALVCYVIGRKKQLSGGDVFVTSLAVSDLLASLFVPLTMVADLSSESNKWYFGAALCKVLPSISPMTLISSSWSLILIAMDRYRVIIHPLKKRLSLGIKIVGILLVWSVAIGVTVPYTISQGLDERRSICIDQGVLSELARNIYVTCWIVTGWGMPFVVIGIIYTLCILELNKITITNLNSVAINRRKAENGRVVKMFIIIVLVFFIFTTPYSVMYVTLNYLLTYKRSKLDINLIMKWNYALFVITTMNSCMNPIIYAKLHKEINQFAKGVFKKINCKVGFAEGRSNAYEISDITSSRTKTSNHTDTSSLATFSCNKAFSNDEGMQQIEVKQTDSIAHSGI